MNVPPESITTTQAVLHRIHPKDYQAIFGIVRSPDVMRFMDWSMPADASSTKAALEEIYASWDAGTEYQWIILEGGTEAIAGTISFRPHGHAADFGYFIGRNFWGRGIAFDAATAVVAWLWDQPEISRIWATVDTENCRSRRLLERLGLQLEGVTRQATVRPNIGGQPRDTAIYARIKTDN